MDRTTTGFLRAVVTSLIMSALALIVVRASPFLQARGMLPLLLGTVAIATWIAGWQAGALSTVFGSLIAAWYLQPAGFRISDGDDVLRLLIFVVVATIISFLHNARERAVSQAQRARDRLTLALTAARMGAWESDLQTGEFWWSDYLEDIFGRRPGTFSPTYDEFLGYIHPEDRQFMQHAMTRSVGQGAEFEVEHRIVRPDRSIRYIITRGRIIMDELGNPVRVVGVAVDITERKSADEVLAEPQVAADGPTAVARSGRL